MADETNRPANLEPGALMPASPADLVPALTADAGEDATWRYIHFFTADISYFVANADESVSDLCALPSR